MVSAETVRRWLHELGWEWKRAKLVAKDDDPQRVAKLARIRYAFEELRAGMALFFADELDLSLLPKVGYQWLPKGAQVEVMTPGTKEKRYLADALNVSTGPPDALCVVEENYGTVPGSPHDPRPDVSRPGLPPSRRRGRQCQDSSRRRGRDVAGGPSPLRAALPADLLSQSESH
jgi:hypothetical protein